MEDIARIEILRVGELSAAQRAELEPVLLDIFLRSFEFPDPALVAERVIFRSPEVKLALLRDREDTILGFMSLGISRLEIEGRELSIVDSGMYVLPRVRGAGRHAIRWAIREALRYKLRHPCTPLVWVGELTSPAVYRRLLDWALVYPRPEQRIPAEIESVVSATMEARGFVRVDESDPWRVHVGMPFRFREPQRIEAFVEHAQDPKVDFFVQRNPGYLRGHWLVAYVSFEPHHLLATALPRLQRWIGNRAG